MDGGFWNVKLRESEVFEYKSDVLIFVVLSEHE